MDCVFKLPNGKEVVTKEFLFKDSKLFFNNSSNFRLDIFESLLVTKGLNVVEKFITLALLREKCIKQSVNLNLNNKDKEVSISYILKNLNEIIDIREEKQMDNITLTLDYPSKFVIDTDSIFSVIHNIQIDNESINLNDVTNEEFVLITNSLPANVLSTIAQFIEDKKHALIYSLFTGKDKMELDFLNASPFILLENLYVCIDPFTYREYLFVLSKRINDVTFLLNSTFLDIIDYMDLYKRENEESSTEVAKLDN